MSGTGPRMVALTGGVGGAKLVRGLAAVSRKEDLLVVANTADDFVHLGLHISPDIDSILYSLAGVADPERGWGRANESWSFMNTLSSLGGPDWFRLGDRDLAMHVIRTARIRAGETLSEVTSELARRLEVSVQVVPMSDDPVRTVLHTDAGTLSFQEYFVQHGCRPRVLRLEYQGAIGASPSPALEHAMRGNSVGIVVLCPSNPYLSLDPILSVPGVRAWLEGTPAEVIAISPIIGGSALKGPAAKLLQELANESSALSVARHYRGLVDRFVIDQEDASLAADIEKLGMEVGVARTLMRTDGDRRRLASLVVEAAADCSG